MLLGPAHAADFVYEAELIVVQGTDVNPVPTAVSFAEPFPEPPVVIVTPIAAADVPPFTVRVKEVTAEGFEVLPVQPQGGDGVIPEIQVMWVAVSPGVFRLPDGVFLEAGAIETVAQISAPSPAAPVQDSIQIELQAPYGEPPAVLTQIQTIENEQGDTPFEPSQPFLNVAQIEAQADSVTLALERGEAFDGDVVMPETIGYVTVSAESLAELPVEGGGGAILHGTRFEPLDAGAGVDDGCGVLIPNLGHADPILVFSLSSRIDEDGGWARMCSFQGDEASFAIDEDQSQDPERSHIAEQFSALIFDAGHVVVPDGDDDGLLDPVEGEFETDPANPDTDGDELSDGEEVELGTNPLLEDTDEDGLLDGFEVQNGTDPLVPDEPPEEDAAVGPDLGLDADVADAEVDAEPDAVVDAGPDAAPPEDAAPDAVDLDGPEADSAADAEADASNDAALDTDGDGVADEADNCRYHPNPEQEDADEDGVGDACDTNDGNEAADRELHGLGFRGGGGCQLPADGAGWLPCLLLLALLRRREAE